MFIALLAGVLWVAAQTPAPAPATFAGIDEAVAQLSAITGMKPVKKVQYDTITREQFKQYLEETIREQIKPEELRVQELALKKFGLVPNDFDLKRATVDLLAEQAAAFYDYRKKKLYLMEGGDKLSQPVLIFHELAHALADQHFDLARFIKRGKTDDSALARMSVMEGQATWLMMESVAQKMGGSLKTMPAMAKSMSGAADQLTGQYPVLSASPLYIRASLLFPYKEGFQFQHAIVEKLGRDAFAKVFRDAPVSSQQILHPELYLQAKLPVEVTLPALANEADYKQIMSGTVGEFDHAILIEQYAGKEAAVAIAPKWRGGSLDLMEHKVAGRITMRYASEWEDEAAAKKMFDAYREVLRKKWKAVQIDSESPAVVSGRGDEGVFQLSRAGKRVVSVEGMRSIADLRDLTAGTQ
jgi:hypothetical protein